MHSRSLVPGPLTIWTRHHVSNSVQNLVIRPPLRESVLTRRPRVPVTVKDVIRPLVTDQLPTNSAVAVVNEYRRFPCQHIVRVDVGDGQVVGALALLEV